MKQKELHLYQVYKTASTIEQGIEIGIPLIFETTKQKLKLLRSKSITFNKNTLLHDYIKACFLWDNDHYFYETTEEVIDGVFDLEFLEQQFNSYGIDIDFLTIRWDKEDEYPITQPSTVQIWYKKNRNKFVQLADKISDDIFYVLFSNRNLLSDFNRMISENFNKFQFTTAELTSRGKIKRINIPKWVKQAVYYRDRGCCTNCTKNISGTISIFSKKNYDHIVPLDLYGTNDPTNIQLLCAQCNKEKLNRTTKSGIKYEYWFD